MRLSKHFTLAEMSRSATATRNNIDNMPSMAAIDNGKALAENVLEPIRVHFGVPFAPSSWYRSEALEKVICRKGFEAWCNTRKIEVSDDSWMKYLLKKSHPRGQAADIELVGIPNDVLFDWIKKNIESYDQLIREYGIPNEPTSGWVHISYNGNDNRNASFSV